jgi:low temperature requirement protein LtrA
MAARDAGEQHRVSTPLELLFDLTFVVAVGQAARALSEEIEQAHLAAGILGYVMVFFAIWWAWMNFTWFASAYDTDDVPYRLLTLVQMAGVLVLAAGVPQAFDRDFTGVTVGYVIMRVAMVGQWSRAARGDRARRAIAVRYASAIAVVQVLWVLRLLLPEGPGTVAFFVLVVIEASTPLWAGDTSWHPHHIAERYGLFTLIVLGEGITAAMVAVQSSVVDGGWTAEVVLVFTGGLVLLFALWWIYYLKSPGPRLEHRSTLPFWWGYGHYGIFAALAALGAGLEVAAARIGHHLEVSDVRIAFAVAVPVAVFLVLVWVLHAPLGEVRAGDLPTVLVASGAVLGVAALVGAGLPLPWAVLGMALPPAAMVAGAVSRTSVPHRSAAAHWPSNQVPGAARSRAASGPQEPGS